MEKVEKIENTVFSDFRGKNTKIFSCEALKNRGIDFSPIEILSIHSNKNVFRGIHFQKIYNQSRLLHCNKGSLFVVVVGIDADDESFGMSWSYTLSGENESLYVPKGYALGTLALEDSDFTCICGDYPFMKEYSSGINRNDEELRIKWPISETELIVSETDKKLPSLKEYRKELIKI